MYAQNQLQAALPNKSILPKLKHVKVGLEANRSVHVYRKTARPRELAACLPLPLHLKPDLQQKAVIRNQQENRHSGRVYKKRMNH